MARPYALRLARAEACTHSLNGRDVDERFREAGFRDEHRGENLGCGWGRTPREMVLFTFRLMQNERSWGGPHWRQMRDTRWRSVGIGVMAVGTQSRIVYDFYGQPAPDPGRPD